MEALRVNGLTKAFGGLKAVDNVSLEFAKGRITGLVGPNGSGKSTLVNLLSGEYRPGAGQIFLGNKRIDNIRPDRIVRLGLSRTYQIPRFPPELTIREVIDVPLRFVGRTPHGIDGSSDAGGIANLCGLTKSLETFCGQLSVTELRRLEIARSMACFPAVMMLDEVMAGLSLDEAGEIAALIRRMNGWGITVIIIEHMMKIIASLCDHVVVLSSGRLLAEGGPADVLAREAVREAYLGRSFKL
jgi:branched-chain amino acid transport system ATP-binding protein